MTRLTPPRPRTPAGQAAHPGLRIAAAVPGDLLTDLQRAGAISRRWGGAVIHALPCVLP
jgi:hypothetical protein